jgi:hypothetical protein
MEEEEGLKGFEVEKAACSHTQGSSPEFQI